MKSEATTIPGGKNVTARLATRGSSEFKIDALKSTVVEGDCAFSLRQLLLSTLIMTKELVWLAVEQRVGVHNLSLN